MAKVIVRAGKIGVIVLIPILVAFLIVYALHVSSSAQGVVAEKLGSSDDLIALKILSMRQFAAVAVSISA
jgi:hypothetical protein